MATYTERVQTMISVEQLRALEKLSRKTGKPISVLLREAIDRVYFQRISLEQRRMAVKRLTSLEAPVSDWTRMEKEIQKGARKH